MLFLFTPIFSGTQLEHKTRVWCIHLATAGIKTTALFTECV